MPPRILGIAAALATVLATVGPARSGDVSIVSAAAVRAPLDAAAALSEAAIGERLSTTFGTAGAVRDRVAGGAAPTS